MLEARAVRPPEGTEAGAICELVNLAWPYRQQWRWQGTDWSRGAQRYSPEAMHLAGWTFARAAENTDG